jgi:hypothetical protein
MKASSIILSTLAAVATAAPLEARGNNNKDFSKFNNFGGFNNQELNYIAGLNFANFDLLSNLAVNNNLNLVGLQNLFNLQSNQFNIQSLLQLQSMITFLELAQFGVFNQFDLSNLAFGNPLSLGLFSQNFNNIDLLSAINPIISNQANLGAINTAVAQIGKSSSWLLSL